MADRDPEQHSLAPQLLEEIYRTEISPDLFASARPAERPTVIVLGGQPGAGKTPMQSHANREFACRGGMVKIIRDDISALLPHYHALHLTNAHNDSFLTQPDIGHSDRKQI